MRLVKAIAIVAACLPVIAAAQYAPNPPTSYRPLEAKFSLEPEGSQHQGKCLWETVSLTVAVDDRGKAIGCTPTTPAPAWLVTLGCGDAVRMRFKPATDGARQPVAGSARVKARYWRWVKDKNGRCALARDPLYSAGPKNCKKPG